MCWLGSHQDSESPVQPGGKQERRSVLLHLVSGRGLGIPKYLNNNLGIRSMACAMKMLKCTTGALKTDVSSERHEKKLNS